MLKPTISGLLFGMAILLSGQSMASVITFDPLTGANGEYYTGHTEAGFTVSPTGAWFESQFFGNDRPSIFSQSTTDSVNVALNNGGDFTFGGVDLACSFGSGCGYQIEGWLDSASVLDVSGTVAAGLPPTFYTVATSFGSVVLDYISITLNLGTGTSYNIDNINVSAVTNVAGPGVMGLLLLGAAGLGFGRRQLR